MGRNKPNERKREKENRGTVVNIRKNKEKGENARNGERARDELLPA